MVSIKDDPCDLHFGARATDDHPILARPQDLLIGQGDHAGEPFLNRQPDGGEANQALGNSDQPVSRCQERVRNPTAEVFNKIEELPPGT